MKLKKAIPSILTSMNLLAGFMAIIINDPFLSPLIILTGAFFDMMDGLAARKLNASSDFGAELDSLADLVSFGVAPAFLYFHHVLSGSNSIVSTISVSFIVIFAALRLAKFNIDSEQKSSFTGLPSPASGIFFSMLVYESHAQRLIDFNQYQYIWLILPVISGLLMVSPVKFIALKNTKDRYNSKAIMLLLAIFLLCGIIWIITALPMIPLAFTFYIIISLIYYTAIIREKN